MCIAGTLFAQTNRTVTSSDQQLVTNPKRVETPMSDDMRKPVSSAPVHDDMRTDAATQTAPSSVQKPDDRSNFGTDKAALPVAKGVHSPVGIQDRDKTTEQLKQEATATATKKEVEVAPKPSKAIINETPMEDRDDYKATHPASNKK